MHIDVSILLLYVVTVITMIAIPGPVLVLVTGAGLTGGRGRAFSTILGTNAASLVLIGLSVLVIQGLVAVNDVVLELVKLFGAFYIAWLGWGLLKESGEANKNTTSILPRVGGFAKGFVMAISNPKDIIFFASFFPQFMGIAASVNASIAWLTVVWVFLDFSTLMLMYLLISKVMKPAFHRIMLRVSGGLLLVVALAGAVMACVALCS